MLYLSTLLFLISQEIFKIPDQFYISLDLLKVIGGHSPIVKEIFDARDFHKIIKNYQIDKVMDSVLLFDNKSAIFSYPANTTSISNTSKCLEIGKEITQINNSFFHKLYFGINQIIYNNNYTFTSQSSQWCICNKCGNIKKNYSSSSKHIQILVFANSTDINKINMILPNNTLKDQSTTIEILYDLNYQDTSMTTYFDLQKGIFYCPSETRCYWELFYIFLDAINYYSISSAIFSMLFLLIIIIFIFFGVDDEVFNDILLF